MPLRESSLAPGGPVKPADVVAAAAAEGYSRAMIYRAREALSDQIVSTKGRHNRGNQWALPTTVNATGDSDNTDPDDSTEDSM